MASSLSLAVVVSQGLWTRVRRLTWVETEAEPHGPEVEPSGPAVEVRAWAAQGARLAAVVEPAQARSVPQDGAEAGVPEPASAPVSRLTGQAAWAGA